MIEDDPFIGWKLSADLSGKGATVYSPHRDARVVEELCESTPLLQRIDVAILDANLETHTSEKLADRLKESEVPFVFYTGDLSPNSNFLHHFDTPVIPKPVHVDVIVNALRRVVSKCAMDRPVGGAIAP